MGVKFQIPSVPSEVELTPLRVRGFDDVDDFELVNPVDRTGAGGTRSQGNVGFRRLITVDLGVVKEKTSRTYLMDWMRAVDRQIVYSGETVQVTPRDPKGFASVVKESLYFRRFAFALLERDARTALPPSWVDQVLTWINMGQTDVTPFGDMGYTFEALP